ncbi:alkaline phosphatase family protein [Zunongwangia endophytica]|uniref:Alkaline phosphatase family protein n=1 Tax=Zunongwangia endophytica TaxID=1808945 RepID=A0ABV8H7Z3_9FLAO|nr:ectonucleotide pyrophosphatase/phosphodiesterase [Zunongwangia endophytica]MDN3595165.1 ectonucleotide pyrophosphatase/phosphodiesterase [Zunongwangia endophytica]
MTIKKIIFVFGITLLPFLANAQKVEHVILVSIDGFRPDFYRESKWPTPNLKMLAENGVSADEVRTIFPSVTYPSHTTLTTGVLPEKHGIYYNTIIEDDGSPGGWVYDFKEIKARTLWEAAKDENLKTASVSWPITVENPFINYNIPEFWSFTDPMDRRGATSEHSNPKGLFEEVMENATGDLTKNQYNLTSLRMDQNLGRIATYILEEYQPNLLTLHLPNLDGAEHTYGREGVEVARAISGADQVVGQIFDAVKRMGMADNTVIIVTGDHGFVTTHTSIAPNIWLKEMGLEDKAYFFSVGGSAFLHVLAKNKDKVIAAVAEGLENLPLVQQEMFRIVKREEIENMQSDPRVKFAISAAPGFAFSNEKEGDLLQKKKGGKHGYFPDFYNIYTGFIAAGKNIDQNVKIQHMQLEDIAVIVAKLLNLSLPEATGVLYPGILVE